MLLTAGIAKDQMVLFTTNRSHYIVLSSGRVYEILAISNEYTTKEIISLPP